jgi:NAD-dependent deacetylase
MDNRAIESPIDKIAGYIVESRRTVVFTGAGISTESGIPDFRSPGGIWERFDPYDFTIAKFLSSAETRRKQWQMFGEGLLTDQAEPNAAHIAIAELHRMGRLDCIITQNIDNLHEKAGVPADMVFELHGNMRRVKCLDCGRSYSFTEISLRLGRGEEIPDCRECGGMLKPDVVMFGEQLPFAVQEEATRRSRSCDLFIVVGSSLVVYPAAYMPQYALQSGARLVIINLSDTPLDSNASIVINAKAGETMSVIVSRVKEKVGF